MITKTEDNVSSTDSHLWEYYRELLQQSENDPRGKLGNVGRSKE